MIPAWKIDQLNRMDKERREAEERARIQLPIPEPAWDPKRDVDAVLEKIPKTIEVNLL